MAITLEANYAKKLGLPNYSSHQYSVTIRTELNDLSQIEAESTRLYEILQDAVDREIQQVGFMPDASTYGMKLSQREEMRRSEASHSNGRNGNLGTTNGHRLNGNGHTTDDWCCSDKQRELIHSIVDQHQLDKKAVEAMAVELFGIGVRELNKLQASGLIAELLERHGGGNQFGGSNGHRRRTPQRGGRR